jgi:hypothetical protein
MKPTSSQIQQAMTESLYIQSLTLENLLDDVILRLSNGNKRTFLSNYSDYSLEDGRMSFKDELLGTLKGMKNVVKKGKVYYLRDNL